MSKENQEILRIRAIAMAKEPEQKGSPSAIMEVVSFALGSENYCLESAFIREVYPMKDFTPLPGVPEYIFGIMNIRGQIMPVIDLKKILQLPDQGLGELNKVIILSHDQIEFGILADTVHGTQSLEIDKIKEVPVTISGSEKTYLMGITLDGLIILDARKFISDKKLVVNQDVN